MHVCNFRRGQIIDLLCTDLPHRKRLINAQHLLCQFEYIWIDHLILADLIYVWFCFISVRQLRNQFKLKLFIFPCRTWIVLLLWPYFSSLSCIPLSLFRLPELFRNNRDWKWRGHAGNCLMQDQISNVQGVVMWYVMKRCFFLAISSTENGMCLVVW